ncbi:MAG: hypothetical protein Q8P67_15885, partial [archaeon]|nr:hypothetical protein [archaeon]
MPVDNLPTIISPLMLVQPSGHTVLIKVWLDDTGEEITLSVREQRTLDAFQQLLPGLWSAPFPLPLVVPLNQLCAVDWALIEACSRAAPPRALLGEGPLSNSSEGGDEQVFLTPMMVPTTESTPVRPLYRLFPAATEGGLYTLKKVAPHNHLTSLGSEVPTETRSLQQLSTYLHLPLPGDFAAWMALLPSIYGRMQQAFSLWRLGIIPKPGAVADYCLALSPPSSLAESPLLSHYHRHWLRGLSSLRALWTAHSFVKCPFLDGAALARMVAAKVSLDRLSSPECLTRVASVLNSLPRLSGGVDQLFFTLDPNHWFLGTPAESQSHRCSLAVLTLLGCYLGAKSGLSAGGAKFLRVLDMLEEDEEGLLL